MASRTVSIHFYLALLNTDSDTNEKGFLYAFAHLSLLFKQNNQKIKSFRTRAYCPLTTILLLYRGRLKP